MTEPKVWQMYPVEGLDRSYVAIDPGLVTGVVTLTRGVGTVLGTQQPWDEAFVNVRDVLLRLTQEESPITVICEAFTITSKTAQMNQTDMGWPLEGIGVARFLARRHGAEFVTQTATEAKRFATNARLRHQGWYVSTPGGHQNDAARHMYLHLAKRRILVPPEGVV